MKPDATPNTIGERQNSATNQYRLAAQRRLYSRAKFALTGQLVIAALFPFGATLAVVEWPFAEPWLAFSAIVLSALDVTVLSRLHRSLRARAALIQEAFDCDVLDLPWNRLKCPRPPPPEEVRKAAARAQRDRDHLKQFENWYPKEFGRLSLPLARLLCQRTNASWDAELRGHLRLVLLGILLVIASSAFAVGLWLGEPLVDLIPFTAVAVLPLFLTILREWQEHGEAERRALDLRDFALESWTTALQNPSGLTREGARQLQDTILDHRLQSPLIPDWLYFLLHAWKERLAVETAGELVAQAERAAQPKS